MALVLREQDVRQLLTMPETIAVLEQAFHALAEKSVANLPRSRIVMSHGVLNILAAAAPALGVLGYKAYTAFREGLRYVIMLYSAQDGSLLAIIEADWLGRIRAGATSALATKYLSRLDSTIVGLIGAGNQAWAQLLGVCTVRPVTTVYVYSRTPENCRRFCEDMTRILNIDVRPAVSAREAVENADILITATTATDPVLFGEWLKPGCHINAIGSNWSNKRELDLSTLQRSYPIVTDSVEQARAEAGDFIIPAVDGLFDWADLHELCDVIAGHGPQRETPSDITLYKGLGIALEDIAAAAHIYALARQRNMGQELQLLD